ncbi:MAG: hypothetical protein NVSMB48_04780 [Marmoricola sp.]
MGAIAIPIVIVVVAVIAGMTAMGRFARRRRKQADSMRSSSRTLHYMVPNGVDPARVVFELSRAGYEAVSDGTLGHPGELLIGGRGDRGLDREQVRCILSACIDVPAASRDVSALSSVRFTDE